MRLASKGDEAAYSELMQRLPRLLRCLVRGHARTYRIPDIDQDDVVQDTLIAIHTRRHLWNPSLSLLPWASTILRNKILDHLRGRARRRETLVNSASLEFLPTKIQESDAMSDRYDTELILSRLSQRNREIVSLIAIRGYTPRDLAHRYGVTESAVRVALHRSLKAMTDVYSS